MGSVGSHELKNTVLDSNKLYITIFFTKQEGLSDARSCGCFFDVSMKAIIFTYYLTPDLE